MINSSIKSSLKEKARYIEPIVRIGKNGITEGSIQEICKHLKKKGLIKIKLLRAFAEEHDREDEAQKLADSCGAELIQVIGNVIVLWKKGSKINE